jgi:hypothetical protein
MGLFSSKSQMKKMGEQSGFEILSLDHRLYLLLPKLPTNRVIISAHGGRELTNANSFTVPSDTILRFYSEDMNTVLDPKITEFYRKEAAPKEILSDGERCFDYILTKYQGKDNNKMGETYESIANLINGELKHMQTSLDQAAAAGAKGNAKAKAKLQQMARNVKMAAVLTIRNRMFRANVSLSEVIGLVRTAVPQIQLFDCLFCRYAKGGKDDAVTLVSR